MNWSDITHLGDAALVLPLLVVAMAGLAIQGPGQRRAALRWALIIATCLTLVAASKIAFYGWGTGIRRWNLTCFSGHTVSAWLAWPALLMLMAPARLRALRIALLVIGTAIAACVGWSRVPLGAHPVSEVIAGTLLGDDKLAKSAFNARVIPSVAYTDPEVAWVGVTEESAKRDGIKIEKAVFPWAASGRAIANGRDEGFTKLIFDAETHQVIGGAIVGTHAGDMLGEICLAIEMGCDATDIGKTIHAHPTLGESIGMAAEVAHGSCTDLPPQRKK